MKFMKRARRKGTEVNASSMADIAFLLLIFFLVTTTIMIDQGITVRLPAHVSEHVEPMPIKNRNVFRVVVNANDNLLVEGKQSYIRNLKANAIEFITNPNQSVEFSETPKRAVISLQNDRGTSYKTYIAVYNELKAAYNSIWDDEAQKRYGFKYKELDKKGKKAIQSDFPLVISEADPTDFEDKVLTVK